MTPDRGRGRGRWLLAGLVAVAAAALGCGADTTVATVTVTGPPVTVTGSATRVADGTLELVIDRQPDRTFIIRGGLWRVCDHGHVVNRAPATARDVRIVATYIDKGVVVGRTTMEEARADGGALGDLAPGSSTPFTFCGIARNEPDVDRLQAAVAG